MLDADPARRTVGHGTQLGDSPACTPPVLGEPARLMPETGSRFPEQRGPVGGAGLKGRLPPSVDHLGRVLRLQVVAAVAAGDLGNAGVLEVLLLRMPADAHGLRCGHVG